MRRRSIAALLMTAVLSAVGCQTTRTPPPAPPVGETPPPATPADVARLKEEILKVDPNAKVGQVTEVSEGDGYALVGDVNAEEWAQGAAVQFQDANGAVIGHGTVDRLLAVSKGVAVKYE